MRPFAEFCGQRGSHLGAQSEGQVSLSARLTGRAGSRRDIQETSGSQVRPSYVHQRRISEDGPNMCGRRPRSDTRFSTAATLEYYRSIWFPGDEKSGIFQKINNSKNPRYTTRIVEIVGAL
ncbi:MAG TPA: hypothetical protein VGD22_01540 [Sphingobacteriaceae bacterium]